jgi:aryl-alcohol dehydrogenase-like predicted oxidoreductase
MTISRTIAGRKVGAVGLGAAGFSVGPHPPEDEAIDTILAALDAGVTLIDSAACYVPSHEAPGHNEALIAKALARWDGARGDVVIATKAGVERIATGGTLQTDFRPCGRPDDIKRQCDIAVRALGREAIELFQLHDPATGVPLAETMGAFRELQDEGKVVHVGLSNVSIAQIEETRAIVDVASVQNSFSPGNRASADVLSYCDKEGIAFLAYSPLGGLGERARSLPDQNPAFADVAVARGVSPHRVALAWELSLADAMIPIPGARRRVTIEDSAAAMDLDLSEAELAHLNGDAPR